MSHKHVGGVIEDSLVDSSVVLPLSREAKHATDDSAAELRPIVVTDLLPFPAIFDLHVTLGHRDSLTVRGQDGSYAHVFNLNIKVLWTKAENRKTINCRSRTYIWTYSPLWSDGM